MIGWVIAGIKIIINEAAGLEEPRIISIQPRG